MDYALKLPDDPTRLRIIAYMTDGYVGNDMQILDHVRKNRGRARMFVFGIGNSVNRFLIEGMAREGRGASEIVDLRMPGEAAAARFHARIHQPILLDPKVDFGELTVEDVYPKAIPDVFSSGPIILKGRYKGAPQGEVTVSGILRGKPWSQKIRVSFPATEHDNAALPALWAREKLEDLQSQDWLGAQSGNPNAAIKQQIVGLALDYRLMSQFTSFVAVEDRVVNVGGKQRRVDVPVEMPEGVSYEDIFGDGLGPVPVEIEGLIAAGRDHGLLLRTRSERKDGTQPRANLGAVRERAEEFQQQALFSRGLRRAFSFSGQAGGPLGPAGPNARYSIPQVKRLPAVAAPVELRKSDSPRRTDRAKAESGTNQASDGDANPNAPAFADQLAALNPNDRRAVLQALKLAVPLRGLEEVLRKAGTRGTLVAAGRPEVRSGRVLVQVWLADPTPANLRALKNLGFKTSAELKPQELLLGAIPVSKLDHLLELPFVLYVDVPKFVE